MLTYSKVFRTVAIVLPLALSAAAARAQTPQTPGPAEETHTVITITNSQDGNGNTTVSTSAGGGGGSGFGTGANASAIATSGKTSSSTWSDGNTIIRRTTDDQFDITLTTTSGITSAVVKDAAGKVLFNGPYTSDEDKSKAPPELAAKLSALAPPAVMIRPSPAANAADLMIGSRLTLAGIKQALGTSDADWANIQEKVKHILVLQSYLGRATAALPTPAPGDNPLAALSESLRAATKDPAATEGDLNAKVAALRNARIAVEADLAQSQKSLEDALSARQRAVLVQLGVL